jgi:hypothetical protein
VIEAELILIGWKNKIPAKVNSPPQNPLVLKASKSKTVEHQSWLELLVWESALP